MRDFSFPLNICMVYILHLKPHAPAMRGAEALGGPLKGHLNQYEASIHLGVHNDDSQVSVKSL